MRRAFPSPAFHLPTFYLVDLPIPLIFSMFILPYFPSLKFSNICGRIDLAHSMSSMATTLKPSSIARPFGCSTVSGRKYHGSAEHSPGDI